MKGIIIVFAFMLTGCATIYDSQSSLQKMSYDLAINTYTTVCTTVHGLEGEAAKECAINYIKSGSRHRVKGSSSIHNAQGTPVYSADECIGAIVNGQCHGSILPKRAVHPRCYGTMLNGQCTGPMF